MLRVQTSTPDLKNEALVAESVEFSKRIERKRNSHLKLNQTEPKLSFTDADDASDFNVWDDEKSKRQLRFNFYAIDHREIKLSLLNNMVTSNKSSFI